MEAQNTAIQSRRRGYWRFVLGGIAVAAAATTLPAGLALARYFRIQSQTVQLDEAVAPGPRVLPVALRESPGNRQLDIPATIHGYIETPVYTKVSGYVKKIYVDKGDRVHNGQLLATLESPELDRQVANAKAYYWLQNVTDRRNQYLAKRQSISRQMADESHATMLQALAAYEQLLAMQSYEMVRAPFDAIITARYVDPGNLLSQSTDSSSNYPILAIASLSLLRVYANVPQSVAPFIKNGDPASVSVPEYTGRTFSGTVTRHREADPMTRTMQVEIDLPNKDFSLYPGMHATVHVDANVSAQSFASPMTP